MRGPCQPPPETMYVRPLHTRSWGEIFLLTALTFFFWGIVDGNVPRRQLLFYLYFWKLMTTFGSASGTATSYDVTGYPFFNTI